MAEGYMAGEKQNSLQADGASVTVLNRCFLLTGTIAEPVTSRVAAVSEQLHANALNSDLHTAMVLELPSSSAGALLKS